MQPCASSVQGTFFPNWAYQDALQWMAETREKVIQGQAGVIALGYHSQTIVTLGRHADPSQVMTASKDVPIFHIERGGGATLHGPGQLVIYPIVKLQNLKLSVMEFTLILEGVAKDLATSYGIQAMVIPGRPGVYVKGKKLGAIGFHLRRGVVTHGLAININNDLSQFSMISPCGVLGQPVASLQSITGKPVDERDLAGQAWRFVCERLGLEYGALTQC